MQRNNRVIQKPTRAFCSQKYSIEFKDRSENKHFIDFAIFCQTDLTWHTLRIQLDDKEYPIGFAIDDDQLQDWRHSTWHKALFAVYENDIRGNYDANIVSKMKYELSEKPNGEYCYILTEEGKKAHSSLYSSYSTLYKPDGRVEFEFILPNNPEPKYFPA